MGRLCRVLLLAACLVAGAAAEDHVIENAQRRINLKNTWAKVIDTITAKNTANKELSEFVACYSDAQAARISIFKVLISKQKQEVARLEQAPAGAPAGVSCYKATFSKPVGKGKTVELDIVTTITGVYKPNPSEIKQGEKQYVEYHDNLYLLSPYPVEAQTTNVLLPTSDVKSFTEDSTSSHSGSKISYGRFERQEPWSIKDLKIHFHHDKPIKRVNNLVREIEVSHWGNIYVEESYEIQNAGSKHTGKFSRLQYSHTPGGRSNAFQQVYAHLPLTAHSMYYKDIIGNISSSDTITRSDNTEVVVQLRYPLMGGWKTDFVLGWSTPLEGFLYRRPKGKLRLLTDFSTSFDDVWVEQMEVRIVLPEGASNIKCTLPFDGVEQSMDKKFTYLDTAGRPVLVLRKSNVVPEHNKKFAVDYSFGFMGMIREPLLLISVFAAFFALVSVYNRLDFTITRDERWHEKQVKERALGIVQQLVAIWDDEADVIDKLVDLARMISNDASMVVVQTRRADLEAQLKDKDSQAKVLVRQLEDISAKTAAAARDHADKSKSLQQRAAKVLSDKADLIKRVAAHEASEKVALPTQQLLDAVKAWVSEGARMA